MGNAAELLARREMIIRYAIHATKPLVLKRQKIKNNREIRMGRGVALIVVVDWAVAQRRRRSSSRRIAAPVFDSLCRSFLKVLGPIDTGYV